MEASKLLLLAMALSIAAADSEKLQAKSSDVEPEQLPCGKYIMPREGGAYHKLVSGGHDARPGEVPFMARLDMLTEANTWRFRCGGSIIDQWHVLTAAHCVEEIGPEYFRVWLGDISRSDTDPMEVVHNVSRVIVHGDYNPMNQYANDIALLKLGEPVIFKIAAQGAINRICLPPKPNLSYIEQEESIVAGWGGTGRGSEPADVLQVASSLRLVTRDSCDKLHRNAFDEKLVHIICSLHDSQDTCGGDSGGPLYRLVGGGTRQELVGITSTSFFPCGSPNPSIHTRVDRYLDWIKVNTIA